MHPRAGTTGIRVAIENRLLVRARTMRGMMASNGLWGPSNGWYPGKTASFIVTTPKSGTYTINVGDLLEDSEVIESQ